MEDGRLTVEKYRPYVTIVLVAINVIVFLLETLSGGSEDNEVLLKYGAQFAPYIFDDGQWYRLFTSMFVHIGVNHIFNNMISLIVVGQYIENYFGRIKYLILYIVSGLAGSFLSLVKEMHTESFAISAGASGAICGLIGALIVFSIDPETRRIFPLRRVIVCIILVLIPAASNVNVTAHIGGMIGGAITGYTMYYYSKYKGGGPGQTS